MVNAIRGSALGLATFGQRTVLSIQENLGPAATLTFLGTKNGAKISYHVKSISVEGGADGDVTSIQYTGDVGLQTLNLTQGGADLSGAIEFVTAFGTPWTITNNSAGPVSVVVCFDRNLSPGR